MADRAKAFIENERQTFSRASSVQISNHFMFICCIRLDTNTLSKLFVLHKIFLAINSLNLIYLSISNLVLKTIFSI